MSFARWNSVGLVVEVVVNTMVLVCGDFENTWNPGNMFHTNRTIFDLVFSSTAIILSCSSYWSVLCSNSLFWAPSWNEVSDGEMFKPSCSFHTLHCDSGVECESNVEMYISWQRVCTLPCSFHTFAANILRQTRCVNGFIPNIKSSCTTNILPVSIKTTLSCSPLFPPSNKSYSVL